MVPKKRIFYAVIVMMICFIYSAASGLTIKKTVFCPQGINEKEVMDNAIGECQKLGYRSGQEGGNVVLTKEYEFSCAGSIGLSRVLYKITPAFATGEDGRKVLLLGGEYIGKPADRGHRQECFECEMDTIEKAVKTYMGSR